MQIQFRLSSAWQDPAGHQQGHAASVPISCVQAETSGLVVELPASAQLVALSRVDRGAWHSAEGQPGAGTRGGFSPSVSAVGDRKALTGLVLRPAAAAVGS